MCYITALLFQKIAAGCDLMVFKDVLYLHGRDAIESASCDLMVFKDVLY